MLSVSVSITTTSTSAMAITAAGAASRNSLLVLLIKTVVLGALVVEVSQQERLSEEHNGDHQNSGNSKEDLNTMLSREEEWFGGRSSGRKEHVNDNGQN